MLLKENEAKVDRFEGQRGQGLLPKRGVHGAAVGKAKRSRRRATKNSRAFARLTIQEKWQTPLFSKRVLLRRHIS